MRLFGEWIAILQAHRFGAPKQGGRPIPIAHGTDAGGDVQLDNALPTLLGLGCDDLPGGADADVRQGQRDDDGEGCDRRQGEHDRDLRPPPHPFHRAFRQAHRPGDDRFAAQPALQVIRQGFGRAVAALRFFVEALEANRFQVAVHLRVQQRRRTRFLLQNLPHGLECGAAGERGLAGQQFVHHRSEPIHVRRRRELAGLARGLFGGDVARGAEHGDRACDRAFPLDQFGQAEIGEMRLAVAVDQYIVGLDVPVQDAALMRVVDRARQPCQQPPDATRRHGRAAGFPGQRAARNQLHAEKVPAFVFADFVDRDDVRMVEARRGGGLGVETLDEILRCELALRDHLEGDFAIQAQLPRAPDDAHAAARDFFKQFIMTQPRAGGDAGGLRPFLCRSHHAGEKTPGAQTVAVGAGEHRAAFFARAARHFRGAANRFSVHSIMTQNR